MILTALQNLLLRSHGGSETSRDRHRIYFQERVLPKKVFIQKSAKQLINQLGRTLLETKYVWQWHHRFIGVSHRVIVRMLRFFSQIFPTNVIVIFSLFFRICCQNSSFQQLQPEKDNFDCPCNQSTILAELQAFGLNLFSDYVTWVWNMHVPSSKCTLEDVEIKKWKILTIKIHRKIIRI